MKNKKPEQLELEIEDINEMPVNENSGLLVDEHIRIFDPNTDEEFVNQRGEQ